MAVEKRTIPFPNSFGWEMGYDTSIVTIGDGSLSVDGVMVRGSRSFRRDPRLGRLVDERYRPQGRAGGSRPEITHVPRGAKWCSECNEWRSYDQFSKDNRYRDKKHPHCKECRARHERRMYALQRESMGQTVRPYNRRKQEETIEVSLKAS